MINPTEPLLCYVAYIKNLQQPHLDFVKELTNRGFPAILSNHTNDGKEYPNCSREIAELVSANRFQNIINPDNHFFILFADNACELTWIELGIALAAKIENICIIGNKPRVNTFCCSGVISVYSDVENYFACRFFN